MMDKAQATSLPSLRALHAFAKVARTGSTAAAARALRVTPSAVSHLLRELEERLGVGLFDRDPGRSTLTEEGRRLFQDIERAFDEIEGSVRRVMRKRGDLRISTVDTFAQFWLIPRLTAFQRAVPSVDLYISTTTRVIDLDIEGIDAAIRWGAGQWPRTRAERLRHDLLMPVAHPAIAARLRRASPEAIAALPLIHARTLPDDWRLWLRSVGANDSAVPNGNLMESRGHAIFAALAGVGAIVIDPALVQDDLMAGRLVPLAKTVVKRPEGYWLVWSENRVPRGPLRQFRDWLCKECARFALDDKTVMIDAAAAALLDGGAAENAARQAHPRGHERP